MLVDDHFLGLGRPLTTRYLVEFSQPVYTCNHLVLVHFHCSSLRKTPGQVQIYQLFGSFAGFSTQYGKRYKHAGTS